MISLEVKSPHQTRNFRFRSEGFPLPKLISTRHTVATSAALLLICLISSMASQLMAADPSFVGVLALAVDSDVATRLKLDDDTRKKLLELIAKREQTALSLALEIKDLPAAVQEERLAPFVAESEKLGFALMTYEQRDELARIRVAQAAWSRWPKKMSLPPWH